MKLCSDGDEIAVPDFQDKLLDVRRENGVHFVGLPENSWPEQMPGSEADAERSDRDGESSVVMDSDDDDNLDVLMASMALESRVDTATLKHSTRMRAAPFFHEHAPGFGLELQN